MAFKIYKKNQYLIIEDTVNGSQFEGLISDIIISRESIVSNIFNIKYLNGSSITDLAFSEIINSNGVNFDSVDSFIDFYTSMFQSVNLTPNTTGSNGTTPYKLISLATTNANIVKASGGNLYSIVALGLTSTVRYLKLYNKATSPIVGTDIPVMTIPIPANTQGAGIAIPFSMGVNFPLGIGLAITATVADNNTTSIGAGDVIVNLTYA